MGIRIRNWSQYQHYKHRNPPWIRVYTRILEDPDWFTLSDKAARFLLSLWLEAAKHGEDGELPDSRVLARRLHLDDKTFQALVSECNQWLVLDDSTTLAGCKHDASTVLAADDQESRVTELQSLRVTEGNASKMLASPSPRKGNCLCPDDFTPSETTVASLSAEGFTAEQITRAVLSMRDWSRSAGKMKKDWDATLRNWVRKDHKPPAKTRSRTAMERNLERNS